MARQLGLAAVAVCTLAAAGCGASTTAAPETTAAVAAKTASALGDRIDFTRANGQLIGGIRFLEVVALPTDCLFAPPPAGGQAVAVRAEVDNAGTVFLPKPDVYGLSVLDRGGFTQKVDSVSVRAACTARFPQIAPSQPAGKTTGWEFITVHEPGPTALVYTPYVAEADSTVDNIKPVAVKPTSATIALPTPLAAWG